MKNIKVIFLKEIKRYFTEPRMLLALFLPGILIYILYSFLGPFVNSNFTATSNQPQNYEYKIVATNNYNNQEDAAPLVFDVFDSYLKVSEKTNSIKYFYIDSSLVDQYKNELINDKYDLLVIFDDDFENKLFENKLTSKTNLSIYYNGSSSESSYLYNIFSAIVKETYTNFTTNFENNIITNPNLSNEDYNMKNIMSFIIPLITISLLFSTISSICPETIAGEKERGTLASILMTPIKRNELVIGKILAITLTSVASGITSFVGLILSLPKLYGEGSSLSSIFSVGSFILLLFLIVTSMLLFVSIGLLISALTKSRREASSYLIPFSSILIVLSIIPFVLDLTNIGYSFVPILNIVSSMNFIIKTSNIDSLIPYLSITIVINILLSIIIVFIVSKLFKKENIMFQR